MPCDYSKYKFSGIYFIKNLVNGKLYVGSSLNITKRLYQYDYLLRHNKCHSPKLQASYNKHGREAFEYGVIQECPEADLKETERYWIDHHNSVNNGYNCSNDTNCSTRGLKHSEETRLKMSKAQKILTACPKRKQKSSEILTKYNKSLKGIPKSEEHKYKIGASNKGKVRDECVVLEMKNRKHTQLTLDKMRDHKLKNPVRYWLGKELSPETRKKISIASSKRSGILSSSYKEVVQLDKDGKEINRFYGAAEASRNIGIGRTSIKNCLCGYAKTAGGFMFKYVNVCQ